MPTHTTLDSPIGPITLVEEGGALTDLRMEDQRHGPPPAAYGTPDPGWFGDVVDQLTAYFEGRLRTFDIPLAPAGTPFQLRVWEALREIPYGATTSYGAIADRIGRPTAARAVGMANGRNPISIIVPCHRVIGANGALVGYGGGLPRKQHLLALERAADADRLFA